MSMTHLPAASHRRMPWKNGRGETIEIAIHPQGAGLEDFGWRLSMAGVTEHGAFSIFPGIDRTLAVLDGAGIELEVQGQDRHRLTPGTEPLAFAADVPAVAHLLGGPVSDLNLMTRRGSYFHQLRHATDPAPLGRPDWLLVLATAPATVRIAGQEVALGQFDALLCDGAEAASPPAPAPDLWLATISRA